MKSKKRIKTRKKGKSLLSYYGFTKAEQKKYPVVAGILRQLTPERIEREIKKVQEVQLPPELQRWVNEYEKVGERDKFLWKWLYEMFPIIRLSITPRKHRKTLLEVKILLTIFVVLLDDIADKKQNNSLLNELLKVPFKQDCIRLNYLNSEEKKYLVLTQKVWNYIERQIKKYPNYKKLNEIFRYDINQVLNAMEYSNIINRNLYLINKTEYWLYLPHNMTFIVYFVFDLMCCSKLDMKELGTLRGIMWEFQKMGRISNWATTWQRELKDEDFTSGVFAYTVEKDILTAEELKTKSKDEIMEKIKKANIKKYLFKEWEGSYNEILHKNKKIKSTNVKKLLKGLEYLFFVDLISQGYK